MTATDGDESTMIARQGAGEQRAPTPSSQDTPPAWPIKMKLREVARLYEEYHRGIDGAPALVPLGSGALAMMRHLGVGIYWVEDNARACS